MDLQAQMPLEVRIFIKKKQEQQQYGKEGQSKQSSAWGMHSPAQEGFQDMQGHQ